MGPAAFIVVLVICNLLQGISLFEVSVDLVEALNLEFGQVINLDFFVPVLSHLKILFLFVEKVVDLFVVNFDIGHPQSHAFLDRSRSIFGLHCFLSDHRLSHRWEECTLFWSLCIQLAEARCGKWPPILQKLSLCFHVVVQLGLLIEQFFGCQLDQAAELGVVGPSRLVSELGVGRCLDSRLSFGPVHRVGFA